MARIHRDFTYDPRATTIATPLVEVFQKRRGVCQDFAHLMIACLRGLQLSARYVSGYLVTSPPPGKPRLQGADASHAWLAVLSPRFGFVDLDPTNDRIVGDTHISLALGRDFGDVTPLRGVIHGGGRHELRVAVDVVPEGELPP
jgi:transglutaminase-like putative cysteine protease